MDIFGIGPLEVLFILVLVLIIFGPKEIERTGKIIGKSLNKFVHSDTWKVINQTSQEIKSLPNRLMRDAGLDELEKTTREELSQAEKMMRHSVEVDPAASLPSGAPEKSSSSEPPEQVEEG